MIEMEKRGEKRVRMSVHVIYCRKEIKNKVHRENRRKAKRKKTKGQCEVKKREMSNEGEGEGMEN